jgi:hypothetical protein
MGEVGGVDEVALRAASIELNAATFRKEHLNLWVDKSSVAGLDDAVWQNCRRDELMPGERIAFGLDFDAERTTGALLSAGMVTAPDGLPVTPLDVIDVSSDFDSLVRQAALHANQREGMIVVQSGSPAASEIPTLEKLTKYGRKDQHRVKVIAQPEMARAVGSFYDAATARRLSHRKDPRLNAAIAAANRRAIGLMTCALPVIRSHSTCFPCARWWIEPLTKSLTTSVFPEAGSTLLPSWVMRFAEAANTATAAIMVCLRIMHSRDLILTVVAICAVT